MSIKTKFCIALFVGFATFYPTFETRAEDASPAPAQTTSNSLTDYIKTETKSTETSGKKSGNWLSDLANKGTQVLAGKKNVPIQRQVKRSNASVFDICGVMLRMDLGQVMDAMDKRGYKKTTVEMEIPNFIRWRYDEQCRLKGVIGYERSASCVNQLAKKNNHRYVQHILFNNYQNKETVDVFFTSNFTGNKVYRVMYQTEAANIKGTGPKAEYLRNLKIYDFWKKINQKYGKPDNPDRVIWGLGENKPSLQADTGRLILNDPMLLELDYTRMSREDQKFMNTAIYTF